MIGISVVGYDVRWLTAAAVVLFLAACVGVCRRRLDVFSRKRLLDTAPPSKRPRIEAHLEQEDSYAASLRSLDLLLRLGFVLSLTFGRLVALPRPLRDLSALEGVAEFLELGLEILLATAVILEIVPAIMARIRPEEGLVRWLGLMGRVDSCLRPVRSFAGTITRKVALAFGGRDDRPSADILEEEILSAAEEGEREGLLASRDIDMIESIIAFGNVEVSDVMTPRTQMVCLDVDESFDSNLSRAIACGHSRIPVFRESKDNIIGLLYVKDLLRYWDRKETLQLKDVLRQPHFVPLTKKIGELLQEFKTQRFHIAIILDEFGGTLGLVTIEDIIEEIVGEITDEYEKVDRPPLRRLSAGMVEVDGRLHIDDFNDHLHTDIPEDEAYDTIGGFVASRLGKIPSVGEALEHDGIRFEVTVADERRVHRMRVRIPASSEEAPHDKEAGEES